MSKYNFLWHCNVIFGCLIKNIESSTIKICKYILCRYSIVTTWAFDDIENKDSLYLGENLMKLFFSFLTENITTVIVLLKMK